MVVMLKKASQRHEAQERARDEATEGGKGIELSNSKICVCTRREAQAIPEEGVPP